MPYTDEHLQQLDDSVSEWFGRSRDLAMEVITRPYRSHRAQEYAMHGVSRRLSTLQHCFERTFEIVPPTEKSPSRYNLMDASAFIQAFIINTFGAIDNLAHVWCAEAQVCGKQGRPLSHTQIGLTPKSVLVRQSLSLDFQEYLAPMDGWFGYLESYRHALAHRIPLYIPPRRLNSAEQAEFERLSIERDAAYAASDWQRGGSLLREMTELGVFEPYIMHSFSEGVAPMRFHAQMVCDLATVVEIGEKMLCELDGILSS